jgi:hypothetical protein
MRFLVDFSLLVHYTSTFTVLSNPLCTVRLILTIPIILCLTLACLSDCVVVLSFTLNRPFIAKNLCEKRYQPGNACQGCCLLRRQMENEDRKDQPLSPKSLKEGDDFQPVPANSTTDVQAPRTGRASFPVPKFNIPVPPSRGIDHPPEVSSL